MEQLDKSVGQPDTDHRAALIRLGLFAGLGYILLLFVLYLIDKKLVLNPGLDLLLANIIYWATVIKAIGDTKMRNGVELSLGEGLRAGITAGIFPALAFHLFMYALFNFIDPSMFEVQLEVIRDSLEWAAGLVGPDALDEDLIERVESEIEASGATGYPLSVAIFGLGQSLVWVALISLVVSLVKKTR